MASLVSVWWSDSALKAKVISAVSPATQVVAQVARAACSSSRVRAGIKGAAVGKVGTVVSTNPLGAIIEGGARPHSIAPHGQAIKFPSGDFVGVSVQHPGQRARPFLKPAVATFPSAYIAAAKARL